MAVDPMSILAAVMGAANAAASIGNAISKAVETSKLKRKLEDVESGKLQGLTEAQRRQAIQRSMEAAGQQAGQAQMQIARDSMADTGMRNMGQYAAAQRNVGEEVAKAGAQATLRVDQLAQELGEKRRQEIMDRLSGAKAESKAATADMVGKLGVAVQAGLETSKELEAAKRLAEAATDDIPLDDFGGTGKTAGASAAELLKTQRKKVNDLNAVKPIGGV